MTADRYVALATTFDEAVRASRTPRSVSLFLQGIGALGGDRGHARVARTSWQVSIAARASPASPSVDPSS